MKLFSKQNLLILSVSYFFLWFAKAHGASRSPMKPVVSFQKMFTANRSSKSDSESVSDESQFQISPISLAFSPAL